ncbi:MAG TPA: VCBS repeat-containing protein [Polyangia bacterium]
MKPAYVVIGWMVAGCGSAAPALPLFSDVTATQVPAAPNLHSLDTAFSDVDEDGDPDVVVAVEGDVNRLYLNDGKGVFTQKVGAFTDVKRDSENVAIADFDRDGHLDAAFASEDDAIHELYLGDGRGGFRDVSDRLPRGCHANAIVAQDLTGDGHPDLLLGCGGRNLFLVNDGRGNFTDEAAQRMPADGDTESTQDLKLGDLNGDRHLDLVVANETGRNRLLLNDGAGKFTDASARLPVPYPEETRMALLFDADGDADLDLVFCNLTCNACGERTRNPQVRLLFNDGAANFTDVTATRMPANAFSSWAGGVIDFDADGDADLMISAIDVPGFSPLRLRAYRNDGRGTFADATDTVLPTTAQGRIWSVATADVDKNGTLDMFAGAWGTQALLLLGRVPARGSTEAHPRP